MTTKTLKYIWTYPAAILIFLVVGGDLPTWHPFYIIAGLLATGGILGYIIDVVISSIKNKRLEM